MLSVTNTNLGHIYIADSQNLIFIFLCIAQYLEILIAQLRQDITGNSKFEMLADQEKQIIRFRQELTSLYKGNQHIFFEDAYPLYKYVQIIGLLHQSVGELFHEHSEKLQNQFSKDSFKQLSCFYSFMGDIYLKLSSALKDLLQSKQHEPKRFSNRVTNQQLQV